MSRLSATSYAQDSYAQDRTPPAGTEPAAELQPTTDRAAAVERGSRRSAWLLAVVVTGAAFVVQASRYGSWLVDDSLISFGYARTLSLGGGLAEQPGAVPVEGVSNITWTLLLAGLRALGIFDAGHVWFGFDDYVVIIRALGLIFFLGTVVVVGVMAGAVVGARLAPLAAGITGLLLVIAPPYLTWAIGGLENPLYGFVVAALAAVLVVARSRGSVLGVRVAVACSLLAVFAAATRPDGAIYLVAYPVVAVLAVRRGRIRRLIGMLVVAAISFAGPAGALLLWRHAAFGLWVPNTAVAKRQEGLSPAMVGRVGGLLHAAGPVPLIAAGLLIVAVLIVAVPSRIAGRERTDARWLAPVVPLLVTFLLAVAAFCILNPDWMREYRFATPAAVLGSALIGIGSCAVLRPWSSRPVRLLALGLVAALLVASFVQVQPRMARLLADPSAPGCYVANRYGRTLNAAAAALGIRSGTLLTPDIGGVLMTSNFRVVDLLGLTDATIAEDKRARDTSALHHYVLDEVKPTLVHYNLVLRGGDYGFADDPQFRAAYTPLIGDTDFVRKDAIPAGADLARARAIATRDARIAADWRSSSPLAGCGPLRPGQTVLRGGLPLGSPNPPR